MAPGSVRMREPDEDSGSAGGSEDEGMSDSGYSYGDSDAPSGSEELISSEEADLGVVEEAAAGGSSKRLGYRVINGESLKKLQRAAIDDVAGIWGCGPGVAKTLLMAYMWDKERLLSEWRAEGARGVAQLAGGLAAACSRRQIADRMSWACAPAALCPRPSLSSCMQSRLIARADTFPLPSPPLPQATWATRGRSTCTRSRAS